MAPEPVKRVTAKSLRARAVPRAKEAERKLLSRSWRTRVVPTWKAVPALIEEAVVIDVGALGDNDLGYGVGEVALIPRGPV